MREIRQIADVCTIIRDGKTAVDRVALDAITDREIVECMGQSVVVDEAAASVAESAELTQAASAPASSAEQDAHAGVRKHAGGVLRIERDGVAIDVPAGSIVGLAGAPVGPSSLIDALTGIAPAGAWAHHARWRARQLRASFSGRARRRRLRLGRPFEQRHSRHAADRRQPRRGGARGRPQACGWARGDRAERAAARRAEDSRGFAMGFARHVKRRHAAEAAGRSLAIDAPAPAGARRTDARRRHPHQARNLRADSQDGAAGHDDCLVVDRIHRAGRVVRHGARVRSGRQARPKSCVMPTSTKRNSRPLPAWLPEPARARTIFIWRQS